MFYNAQKKLDLLKVDDTFARLVDVSNSNDLTFEFVYSINQIDAIKNDALSVNVSVISKHIRLRKLSDGSQAGAIDSKRFISNVLMQIQNAKTTAKEQETYVVAQRLSDVTAKINNDIIPQLKAGVPAELIPALNKQVIVIKQAGALRQDNEPKPLLQLTAHTSVADIQLAVSQSIQLDTRLTMLGMIEKDGLDPSVIASMTQRSVSAKDSFEGLLRRDRFPEIETSFAVKLLNRYVVGNETAASNLTTDVNDAVMVHVVENVIEDEIDVPIKVVIPSYNTNSQDSTHYFVKFELIDTKTGLVVDSTLKPLDVSRHVHVFFTPKVPPRVDVAGSDLLSKLNLKIKQIDVGATAVNVYKKVIPYAFDDGLDDGYTFVGTYGVTSEQQTLLVSVDRPSHNTVIYRVVPVGKFGNAGFEYTNVVVKSASYRPTKFISVVARTVDTGVNVEIRGLPFDAVAIAVLARNLTIHEQDYRIVGDDVTLVDDALRGVDHFSVTDTTVTDGMIYEYVAKIIGKSGVVTLSGNATHEYIKLVPGKIDTKLSNVVVSYDINDPNVTFNVSSALINGDSDVLLSLLKNQDLRQYFDNDIAKEREFLNGLIAHNVQRINLTTGVREDFGTITSDLFDDRELRKNQAIQPLKIGNSYRYEVTAFVRSPETMFQNFIKTRVDKLTNKAYTFDPAKFLHPLALTHGILVSSVGLRTLYAKDAMAHGNTGVVTTTEVSFDEELVKVRDATATRFDRTLNVVTWKVDGSIEQVDHFLILKDVYGIRSIVGKAHSEFEFGNVQYHHVVSEHDVGELRYVIVPIMNDYNTSAEVTTNPVILSQTANIGLNSSVRN